MLTLNVITLFSNGLTLALALGFLLVILWHDSRKELNQLFAIFLFLVVLWNAGSLLVQISQLTVDSPSLLDLAVGIMELGFTGASVAAYFMTTVMIGVQSKRLRVIAFASLFVIVVYRIFLIVSDAGLPLTAETETVLGYRFQPLFIVYYLLFDSVTLFLVWRYRRKIRSRGLAIGMVIFVFGQMLILLNEALAAASFSITVSSIGTLIVSFAIVQQEIITPVSESLSQVEAMHTVSLAVTSQIAIDTVLSEIALQAAGWLGADGVGIFLTEKDNGNKLKLVTVHNLPDTFLDIEVPIGQGVAGTVAETLESIYLENYRRDWRGVDDVPLARETFGCVICVPLIYAGEIIGVLMVVAGQQARLFDPEDVHRLELLGAQAAVAIAHSRLFAEQQQLTEQLEIAHSQLETVLTSTENPVIAVDRKFKLIFANPAAQGLFPLTQESQSLIEIVPKEALPNDIRSALREIRRRNGHVYEISLDDKTYLCHLAALGDTRIAGWVAVLNDISQLKELDRLKSEMVRMVSHDLKNPLMGALAYLDLLREDLSATGYKDTDEALSTIEWQLERMSRIIRGVLDLERLREISSSLEICHPSVVINSAISELSHFVEEKNVEVGVAIDDDMPEFLADREQFERALINLLENAIKFTMSGGRVDMGVSLEADNIVFRIADNGVGIPKVLQAHVFDRFFRGQQKGVEHVAGSGLGLSLVKTIVENHQGKVWFESQEGVGTTFFVSIPAVGKNEKLRIVSRQRNHT